jgi:hypothetical protein
MKTYFNDIKTGSAVKYIFTVIVLFCVLSLCARDKVYAVDLTAGISTWYAWGKLYADNITKEMHTDGASWLFGPTLSLKLNHYFNITFVYLYGKLDYEEDKTNLYPDFKSKRKDADLALNLRLSNYFKLFFGLKSLSFDILRVRHEPAGAVYPYKNDGKHSGFGPGIGLSATFPLAENLFLLATLSGCYLSGNENIKEETYPAPDSFKSSCHDTGFNATASLAYYIAPAATVISLGYRHQEFNTKYNHDSFSVKMHNSMDGIMFSATYTFAVGVSPF